MAISFRRLSYSLGAEVLGAEPSLDLDEPSFKKLYEGFLDHGVLLFRGYRIDRAQQLAFSRRFGKLDRHESVPSERDPDFPEILLVTNKPLPDGGVPASAYTGQLWHSDFSFTLVPALGSLLRGVVVPQVGGDTSFANMYAAYDALSSGMQQLLSTLHAVHSPERKNAHRSREWEAENRRINQPVAQPVVRTHPETGRKALYVGEKVKTFENMTEEESRPLLDFLIRHATQSRFVYRHAWRADDLLLWDNRCTMHAALGDYDPSELRHMERTTIRGTPSGRVLSQPAGP